LKYDARIFWKNNRAMRRAANALLQNIVKR
jgi:hypothetical protein